MASFVCNLRFQRFVVPWGALAILFIVSAAFNSCGNSKHTVGQDSDTRDITIVHGAFSDVIFRDGDVVLLKRCKPNNTADRNCIPQTEPRIKAFADFVRGLNEQFGVIASVYKEVGGLSIVRRDIETAEKIATEPGHTPGEIERAVEQLNFLHATELRLMKADHLLAKLSNGNDLVLKDSLSDDAMRLKAVFNSSTSNEVWFDRYNKVHWRFLGVSFNWYDAAGQDRMVDALGRPNGPFKNGCARNLGPAWRLPTIYDVDKAIAVGFRNSSVGVLASMFWTAEPVMPGTGVPSAYVYSMEIRGAQSRPTYFEASVFCVSDEK